MKVCVLCLSFLVLTSFAVQAELYVISHKSVNQTTLSKQEVKDIFLGNKQYWPDKSKITLAALSEGEAAKHFFQTYLGMSPAQYNGLWSEKLYTGGKLSPRRFKTSRLALDFVTQTTGAIGFIDSASQPKDVNIIEVK